MVNRLVRIAFTQIGRARVNGQRLNKGGKISLVITHNKNVAGAATPVWLAHNHIKKLIARGGRGGCVVMAAIALVLGAALALNREAAAGKHAAIVAPGPEVRLLQPEGPVDESLKLHKEITPNAAEGHWPRQGRHPERNWQ